MFAAVFRPLCLCLIFPCLLLSRVAQSAEFTFVAEDLPPFSYGEDGRVGGPSADVLRAVCRAMEVTCRIELLRWQRAYALAKEGKRAGVIVLARNAERDGYFYFSQPVVRTGYGVFVKQANQLSVMPGNLDTLRGHQVVAYGPSNTSRTLEELAQRLGGLEVFLTGQNEAALRMVRLDRYGPKGATFINRDVGHYLIRTHNIDGLRFAGFVTSVDYHFGFSRLAMTTEQVRSFAMALNALYESGEMASILNRHAVGMPDAVAMLVPDY